MATETRDRVSTELRSMQPRLMPVAEPVVYSARLTICVCLNDTLSTCRQCGMPACGNCLDTPKHAARFHREAK